jgi:hypothetical protein
MSSSKFLRTLSSGLKLYLRSEAVDGSWRRVTGLTDEDYFSKYVGGRVEEEASKQVEKVQKKTGVLPERVVIEYAHDE